MNRLVSILFSFVLAGCLPVMAQSESRTKTWREGYKAYSQEDYETAARKFKKLAESEKDAPKTSFNLGNAFFKQEKLDEAGEAFKFSASAFENKLDRAKALHNLGNTYLQKRDFKKAIDAYRNALRLNPDDDDTRYNLAKAMQFLQEEQQKQQQGQDQQEGDNDGEKDPQSQNGKGDKDKDDGKDGDRKQEDPSGDGDEQQDGKDGQGEEEEKPFDKDPQERQQKPKSRLNPQEAEQLLQMLEREEEKTLDKQKLKKHRQSTSKTEKDW